MTDFIKEGIQQGDILYSLRFGEVEVTEILHEQRYPIEAKVLETGDLETWNAKGDYITSSLTQDLYWAKPEIIAPPRPKREVTKEFEVFVNYDPDNLNHLDAFFSLARATNNCIATDIQIKGKLTFTVIE